MSPLKPPRPWPLDTAGKPKRRVAVPGNRGVYWRPNGLLEVGYQDADGRWRWRSPFQTITAARAARDEARTKARGGVRESADPRLKFGEAADRWLAEQVVAAAVDAGELYELRRESPAPALGRPAVGRDRGHRGCGAGARVTRGRARRVDDLGHLPDGEPRVQVRAPSLRVAR